jgi:hypothetical protein
MKIGTIATGAAVETTINLNYVPQYIYYVAATQLSSIRVTVEGDGTILDLDTTGLTAVGSITRFGTVANAYLIPLADGLVKNKVTQLTFTNSAAQTPDVFAGRKCVRAESSTIGVGQFSAGHYGLRVLRGQ